MPKIQTRINIRVRSHHECANCLGAIHLLDHAGCDQCQFCDRWICTRCAETGPAHECRECAEDAVELEESRSLGAQLMHGLYQAGRV